MCHIQSHHEFKTRGAETRAGACQCQTPQRRIELLIRPCCRRITKQISDGFGVIRSFVTTKHLMKLSIKSIFRCKNLEDGLPAPGNTRCPLQKTGSARSRRHALPAPGDTLCPLQKAGPARFRRLLRRGAAKGIKIPSVPKKKPLAEYRFTVPGARLINFKRLRASSKNFHSDVRGYYCHFWRNNTYLDKVVRESYRNEVLDRQATVFWSRSFAEGDFRALVQL